MRLLFVSFLLLCSLEAAMVSWLSRPDSGMVETYTGLQADLAKNNAEVMAKWAQIRVTLEELAKQIDKKKRILEAISSLEEAKALALKEQVFLVEQEKKIMDTRVNVEAINAESQGEIDMLELLMFLKTNGINKE